uniref:Secreted protein n=1 Tax=Xiphophorus couchianus TaxID=32473 RepID=A0A3B5LIB1_9TELE
FCVLFCVCVGAPFFPACVCQLCTMVSIACMCVCVCKCSFTYVFSCCAPKMAEASGTISSALYALLTQGTTYKLLTLPYCLLSLLSISLSASDTHLYT